MTATQVRTFQEQEEQSRLVRVPSEALTPYTRSWVRRYLFLSFINFLIAGTFALMMRTDQASAAQLLGELGSPGVFGQLETAHGIGMFVGWQFAFTYGLCTYIFPKYMKRKIWSEKLLPLVFYFFAPGIALVWIACLFGFGPGWYFLFPLPFDGGPGGSSPWPLSSSLVFFAGMLLVNISLVVFCINMFGTAFSNKYDDVFNNSRGMNTSISAKLATAMGFDAYMPDRIRKRIVAYPVAVIGAVVTCVDMFVTVWPFFALLVDGAWQSLGFASYMNNLVSKNFLWLNHHPIVYFAFFPLVGMYYTLIPVFANRAFESSRWVRAPWPLLLIPGVGVYSHHIFMDTAQPFALQIMSQYMTMIIALGSGISVFTLMGLIWRSKYNWNLTARWIMVGIIGWVLGGIIGIQLGNISYNTYGHNTYMVLAHFHYNALGGIVPAGFGILYWIFPEITNRKWYSAKLSEMHFWGTSIFAFAMITIFAAMGYIGVPRKEWAPIIPQLPFTAGYSPYLLGASICAFGIAFSQIPFIINIIRSLKSKPLGTPEEIVMPTPEFVGYEPRYALVRFVPVSENASLQETLGGPTLGAATGGQETDVKSNPVRGQRDSFATGRK
jgi:heme/copper-type cytochrome/quinol oxidase subunit 1